VSSLLQDSSMILLGNYLVKRFNHEGAEVIAVSRTATSKRHSFPDGVRPVDMDITKPQTLLSAIKDADIVIHCAAKVGDWGNPREFAGSIRDGTAHLLGAVDRKKTKQFIYISSIAVYGMDCTGVVTEDLSAGVLSLPYAIAKVAAEEIVTNSYKNQNIPITIIRPANIYGPGSYHWTDRPAEIIRKGLMNLPAGFGKSNTVFVANVVEAIAGACNSPAAIGEAFNVMDDFLVGWDEFFLNYASVYGKKKIPVLPVWVMKSIAGSMEIMSRINRKPPLITKSAIDFLRFQGVFSIEKIRKLLNCYPPFGKEQAFAITREYLRNKFLE
jgi:nucleoside-diphosphate-sugar epimerase